MKPRGRKTAPRKTLTAVELEMMNIIWRLGACTVTQVKEALAPGRNLAYTSVSTIIRILEQKGILSSERAGRGHLYSAAMSKQEFQALSLAHLVDSVFDRTPSLLVLRLLDSDRLSEQELDHIRALLRAQDR
jgi:predicted transcriptional regulator